jgi:uncharacterized protein YeeX (DUF496 family)
MLLVYLPWLLLLRNNLIDYIKGYLSAADYKDIIEIIPLEDTL